MAVFEEVFNFDNLYRSARKCCNGVRWKTSVKNFERNIIENTANLQLDLLSDKYKMHKTYSFPLRTDRGKIRQITALHINDRPIQRCICDHWLNKVITKKLIYNSGACLEKKGFSFSINNLKKDLRSYATKYKNKGYVLTIDFKDFFNSIDHRILFDKIEYLSKDKRLNNLLKYTISNTSNKNNGINLGNQSSHIIALYFLNLIDHYIKEHLHIKYYGRYMDDCYLISNNKQELKEVFEYIKILSNQLKLNINIKKSHIKRVKNFMFLNRHWYITKSGKVICKLSKITLRRLRKRYRYLRMNKPNRTDQFLASVKSLEKQCKGVLNYVKA